MPVSIEVLPARHVASLRHIGPYNQVGKCWDELCQWAAMNGYLQAGVEMLGLSYDDPDTTLPSQIRYDACISVEPNFKDSGKIIHRQIAEGEYAVYRHRGSYNNLSESYAKLIGHWLPQSGRELADEPCLEKYWNDPESTPEDELETDICIKLKELA